MSDVQQRLHKTVIEMRRLDKVASHLESLYERLREEERTLRRLEKSLREHEQDLSKLEGTSVRGLFLNILGDKEHQLEIERQEYLQQALRYNELVKSIDIISYEIDVLEKKNADRDTLERNYRKLVRLREEELMQSDPEVARRLRAISSRLEEQHVLLRDLEEAEAAGEKALQSVKSMLKSLRNARNWGQWDMYSGSRGFWKHRSIDKARDQSYRVKHSILTFKQELSDVYPQTRLDVTVAMEGFEHFTDIFFDNLITDWVMQQKIKKALDNVLRVKRQVSGALSHVRTDIPATRKNIADLEKDREEMVVGAGLSDKMKE